MELSPHRIDLSDWVIHFVHNRKSGDDLYVLADIVNDEAIVEEQVVEMPVIHYYDKNGEQHSLYNEYSDKEFDIEDDAPAFEVLKKIVHDGFIRSGWSFRNFNPTIYGPFSAVCFTEMPLYALIDYAKTRAYSGYVGNYGIAFKKKELFAAGARPVIYGVSGKHLEVEDVEDSWSKYGMRVLDRKCGIGLQEQYRYVYTDLNRERPADWTHEREWRWPLRDDRYGVGGMPFLLRESYSPLFTEVVLIVKTKEEQSELLEQVKNQYDSGIRDCGFTYNRDLLGSVRVVALDELAEMDIDQRLLRIEDIPSKQMLKMPELEVSDELRKKVQEAVAVALHKGEQTIETYRVEHPEYEYPVCNYGYGYVITYEITAVTQALLEEGIVSTYADGKYRLYLSGAKWPNEDVDLIRLGAQVAADYLTQALGQKFYVETILN